MSIESVIVLLLLLATAIPINRLINIIRKHSSQIDKQLEKEATFTQFSKTPLLAAICIAYNFLKGYLPIYITDTHLYFNNGIQLVIIAVSFTLHTWSPFLGFRRSTSLFLPLYGIYVFMAPELNTSLFPIIFILATLLLNSIPFGLLISICAMFFSIWFLNLPLYLIPANFILFLLTAFALKNYIFLHLERSKKWTLKSSFENRLS